MIHKTTENQAFSTQIISWYRSNPRELPWRGITDPYKIWLSEIILQQTRVAQGLPYYYAFSEAYPSVKELALAPESEVLRLWQGLGYYSRARNLHSCAKYIWFELDGKFPDNYQDLLLLKGVGSYTAAAISSFAFGEAKAVVDGNVFRVLARYFGIATDIGTGKAKKEFEALADQLIPKSNPGEFNQAMMDFGARLCIPKNPDCGLCPLKSTCFAFQKGLVKELPVKINKTKVKERNLHYFVIQCGQDYVWNKRKAGDIWEGLHDFPMEEKGNEKSTKLDFPTDQKPAAFLKKYRHILSHQKLNASFSKLDIPIEKYPELAQWCENEGYFLVAENEIAYLPKPKLIVNFLNDQGI
ncbi:A/G-specific adenine glycosylase [Algoriphagus boritolerans]|uniref:Adenine DNA glycosylase n=1 Tax=Algoriphagus boritolerans DSM 17298 = JCM 18970 TaxID=1120964 RepID=A0A1H5YL23_9BACT|nr:A/G-specific adenine glycosylase [Algoriphagus boritolerans]SEG24778.1 A/G-specific DNA-adenine glycosylase [Algoriphagus boritolerans DSM 17298 = JCM 18970]